MKTIVDNNVKEISSENNNNPENDSRVLLVKWKDTVIGLLLREKKLGYFFKYYKQGLKEAKEQGFSYLIGFKDQRKLYTSPQLFSVFQSRVPTRQRRDLEMMLEKVGLDEYDEFEYLAATGGKTNTDSISFEEIPIEKIRTAKELNSVLHSYGSKKSLDNQDKQKVLGEERE